MERLGWEETVRDRIVHGREARLDELAGMKSSTEGRQGLDEFADGIVHGGKARLGWIRDSMESSPRKEGKDGMASIGMDSTDGFDRDEIVRGGISVEGREEEGKKAHSLTARQSDFPALHAVLYGGPSGAGGVWKSVATV